VHTSHLAISLTIACSRYIYNGIILHAHPVRGESHNKRNATGKVATNETFFTSLRSYYQIDYYSLVYVVYILYLVKDGHSIRSFSIHECLHL